MDMAAIKTPREISSERIHLDIDADYLAELLEMFGEHEKLYALIVDLAHTPTNKSAFAAEKIQSFINDLCDRAATAEL